MFFFFLESVIILIVSNLMALLIYKQNLKIQMHTLFVKSIYLIVINTH